MLLLNECDADPAAHSNGRMPTCSRVLYHSGRDMVTFVTSGYQSPALSKPLLFLRGSNLSASAAIPLAHLARAMSRR